MNRASSSRSSALGSPARPLRAPRRAGAPASSRAPAAARCSPRRRASRAAPRSRSAGQPSTSRAISAARWRGGSSCSAARNASSIVSRSTTTASGSSSARRDLVQQPVGVRLQPRHLGERAQRGHAPRAAAQHVEADVRRDAVEPGAEQRAAVERVAGCATRAGTSPARRPRPRRTRRASGSSGRAARGGAARPAPRTRSSLVGGGRHAALVRAGPPAAPTCCRPGRRSRRTSRSRVCSGSTPGCQPLGVMWRISLTSTPRPVSSARAASMSVTTRCRPRAGPGSAVVMPDRRR